MLRPAPGRQLLLQLTHFRPQHILAALDHTLDSRVDLGLDPAALGIIGLKSSVHFLADFGMLTPEIIYAAFPGLNTADPAAFAYRHLRPHLRLRPGAGARVLA